MAPDPTAMYAHSLICISYRTYEIDLLSFLFIADEVIFCFFSVLRQFKIVKPTRQPWEKQQALKTTLPLHVVWMSNMTKI
jgi:hypothetical protein